jgi:hypothetical protein
MTAGSKGRMTARQLLNDDVTRWVQGLQSRIKQMLDPSSGVTGEETFEQLMRMAQQFLSLSKEFLGLAITASNAADSMVEKSSRKRSRRTRRKVK